jgi:hypothetical protein
MHSLSYARPKAWCRFRQLDLLRDIDGPSSEIRDQALSGLTAEIRLGWPMSLGLAISPCLDQESR